VEDTVAVVIEDRVVVVVGKSLVVLVDNRPVTAVILVDSTAAVVELTDIVH